MTAEWTSQRVKEFAPDAASITAGRGLALSAKWPLLGRSAIAVWGEVKGSGKKPYQVQVDLREAAFKCSCPSRKLPCKHVLGLLFILAEQSGELVEGELPEWVDEWLAAREARASKQQEKVAALSQGSVDPAARDKRIAQREAKIASGIEQLKVLLADLVRHGFAWAQVQPNQFWENAAGRLVDAQAPGLARNVRELSEIVSSGDQWQSRFLRRLARLHLAVEGYQRLATLSAGSQADLRALVGWTTSRDELLATPAEVGLWCVAARRVDQEDRLTVQRTWLMRVSDGRPALVLDFAAQGQVIESSLMPGLAFPAEIHYYPGTVPVRAIVGSSEEYVPMIVWPGFPTIEAALDEFASVLASNPWIESWPLTVDQVKVVPPAARTQVWHVCDQENAAIPLASGRRDLWPLLSVSGGVPLSIFGQWDGEALTPLGAWCDGAYYTVTQHFDDRPLARVA